MNAVFSTRGTVFNLNAPGGPSFRRPPTTLADRGICYLTYLAKKLTSVHDKCASALTGLQGAFKDLQCVSINEVLDGPADVHAEVLGWSTLIGVQCVCVCFRLSAFFSVKPCNGGEAHSYGGSEGQTPSSQSLTHPSRKHIL